MIGFKLDDAKSLVRGFCKDGYCTLTIALSFRDGRERWTGNIRWGKTATPLARAEGDSEEVVWMQLAEVCRRAAPRGCKGGAKA